MTTFNYTSGDPSHLAAGQNASMADIQGPLVDLRTFVNGNITDINLSASAAISEAKLATGSSGLAKGAFYAHRNATQSIANITQTTVQFNAELFDVSGWFDTVTNIGRYTPQVPGYYRFSWLVQPSAPVAADTAWQTTLRKNGADYAFGITGFQRAAAQSVNSGGTAIAIANGTTDFFEVTIRQDSGIAVNASGVATGDYFTGELIGRS